jgi:hypothetical protein
VVSREEACFAVQKISRRHRAARSWSEDNTKKNPNRTRPVRTIGRVCQDSWQPRFAPGIALPDGGWVGASASLGEYRFTAVFPHAPRMGS